MGTENDEGCGCCCEEEDESFGAMMVEVADKAWMKVMQRKLEAMIEKRNGKEMDRVASVAYDYAHRLYALKMDGKEMPKGAAEEFEKKLMAAMK
ncbi:MAG: hypothetical protein WC717_02180 [Candidatus Micrarchaeia archaeon]|jgi:hypothetical protein